MALTKRGYDEDWERKQAEEAGPAALRRYERSLEEDKPRERYGNKNPLQPPNRYERGFIEKLDKRSVAAKFLRGSYQEVMSDLGGEDSLSIMQRTLAEKFCFLSFWLRTLELQVAKDPESKDANELYARWVQGLNSLTGLSKTIGLERRAKQIESLQSYVTAKKKKVTKKTKRRTA